MTVFRTIHRRLIRFLHTGSAPGRPALTQKYLRSTNARVMTATPDVKETNHYYDPLTPVSPPSQPPAHDGEILSSLDRRVVRRIHDGDAPPPLMLDVAYLPDDRTTEEFSPATGRKVTTDYYDPAQFVGPLTYVIDQGKQVVDNGYPVVIAA